MDINGAGLYFGFAGPACRDQVVATVHDTGHPHEMQKQPKLEGGEIHGVTVPRDPNARDV
ncbi:hypothetical protein SAMCCGM7_pC0919 (plasmid) [Sinorhizobium americanum CCGM7]|nr:hypothetical protein SAMCCGM7_pC0919 [Sinorhizobium americanum CCGM7]